MVLLGSPTVKVTDSRGTNDKSPRPSVIAETDDVTRAIRSLGVKLAEWLIDQPEWLYVLGQGRTERKRLGKVLADTVSRIPKVGDPNARY